MIVLLARYFVKPGHVPAVLDALRRMSDEIKSHEPGCVQYQVSVSTEHPQQVLLYEGYRDEPALLGHRDTAHFKSIIEGEILPMLEKREREILEVKIS